jgi:poly-D-alanine transfer protein DltD
MYFKNLQELGRILKETFTKSEMCDRYIKRKRLTNYKEETTKKNILNQLVLHKNLKKKSRPTVTCYT